ncbi:Uncharacterised protein [Salmonella enterica subsp. arizonae]|nr:putative transcriptional regulator [Salmonella enterica subsp. diarizonae serovar 60:r:e,n,x,z15 str. 01-0170]SUG60211.1 Uncharacterised protein [Salmonella enterica subsp. arizonae]
MSNEMVLEVVLQMMREELQLSQKHVVEVMGISQQSPNWNSAGTS